MKTLKRAAISVMAALLLAVFFGTAVYAEDVQTLPPPSSASSEPGTAQEAEDAQTLLPPSSASPESGAAQETETAPAVQGGVEVVGYEIRNREDTGGVVTINADDYVVIRVRIKDGRVPLAAEAKPNATLNSSSFRSTGGITSEAHGMGQYTVIIPCVYLGTGKTMGFDLSYADNSESLPMYHVSITLNQCVEKPEPEETEEPEVRGTGFILKSLSYGNEAIYAGNEFTVNAVLMATNGDVLIDNVAVTAILPKEIELAGETSVVYIGTVRPNMEIPVKFLLSANAAVEQGSYRITLSIAGARNDDGTEVKASVEAPIPIKQPDRFGLGNVSLPDQLNTAQDSGTGFSSVSLINKGKGIIYNVTVTLLGEHLTMEEGSVFVGNIAPGTQAAADFNVKADETGKLSGTVVVTYENGQGEEKTLTHPFSVQASAQVDMPSKSPVPAVSENETNEEIPSWLWLVAGVTVCLGFIVVNGIYKRRKAEQILRLEESFADDVV